ncbi:MAG: endonuclease V [Candidatus Hermodarchaeota archaeon]
MSSQLVDLEQWIKERIPAGMEERFQQMRAKQISMRKKIVIKDHPKISEARYIGGTDVSFFSDRRACAGIVILEMPDLTVVEFAYSIYVPNIPYVPTFLAFRELSGLLVAYNKLKIKPDIILVDGNGILHPYGIGIASQMGIELETPTIGAAKKLLLGTYEQSSLKKKGSTSPIFHNNQEIGTAILTREGNKPIFVSSGHLISIPTAIDVVLKCTRWRIPEPTRLADKLTRDKVRLLKEKLQ